MESSFPQAHSVLRLLEPADSCRRSLWKRLFDGTYDKPFIIDSNRVLAFLCRLDSHPLHAARGAALDGHGGFTTLEVFGDQSDKLLIGVAINWSRSESGEPGATLHGFKRTGAGVGLDLDADNGGGDQASWPYARGLCSCALGHGTGG